MNRPLAAALLLCLSLLSSCIEGDEEIWIHPDASGRLLVHYEFPRIALRKMPAPEDIIRTLQQIDKKEKSFQITTLSLAKQGHKVIFHLEASFEDVRDLLQLSERYQNDLLSINPQNPRQMNAITGQIDFKIDKLTPTFSRTINLAKLFPPIATKTPKLLGPSTFTYTIHLPAKVKETNAHFTSTDKRTLRWTFPLQKHLKQPIEMAFTTQLPLPSWVHPLLYLLLLPLLWLIWKVSRRLRTKHPSPPHNS